MTSARMINEDFLLGWTAQGLAVRFILEAHRSRKAAENAVGRKKYHLWQDTNEELEWKSKPF